MPRIYHCDACGRESDPKRDTEPYDEREILPGPSRYDNDGGQLTGFVQLRAHRETTGDRIWCMSCWVENTEKEITSDWKDAYFLQSRLQYLGRTRIPEGESYYHTQSWHLKQCRICGDWCEFPEKCPVVETTVWNVLLDEAGKLIDGWFFGVLFKEGKPVDFRCKNHITYDLEAELAAVEADFAKFKTRRKRNQERHP